MPQSFIKDPSSILDYQVNWATFLGTDTISRSAWTVPTGITQASDTNTTTTATIWLSGGTDGSDYELANKIVTAGGRTAERTIRILARQR